MKPPPPRGPITIAAILPAIALVLALRREAWTRLAVAVVFAPVAGISVAPELLPAGWGAFGQLLPQGATATLLRSAAYFSGAGATSAVVVLACWAVVGALLVVIAALRGQARQ